MEGEALTITITSVSTGVISTAATIAALKVHIKYLNSAVERLEQAVSRAHARIDALQKR